MDLENFICNFETKLVNVAMRTTEAFYNIFMYLYNKNILEYGKIAWNGTESKIPDTEGRSNTLIFIVMLLPTVKPSMLPPTVCPLLVFVNGKSGGGQGLQLINSFRKLLNPHQVFDLCNGGPLCG